MGSGDYFYTGAGAVAILALIGFSTISFYPEQEDTQIKVVLENPADNEKLYSAVVAEDAFFSEGGTVINFSSETEPEKTIRCEFACTRD